MTTVISMDADGTDQTRRTFDATSDAQPAWSPDGARIVFTVTREGNREIYVMNPDGSGQTNLTNNASKDIEPTWGPGSVSAP